eukprot:GHUV01000860.1.p1 GENE.GHUV01000860.1~~GHUV01000860.1.p1  ORF type:complete len:124 (+),score=36.44 GHUV01000860.1:129-500(+)
MLRTLPSASTAKTACKPAEIRRLAAVVRAQAVEDTSTRRSVLSIAALSLAAAAAGSAQARDYREALRQKEARRAKLKGTAGNIKETGKDQQVFRSSDYMVSEEARTPNVHSRQNEGAKTQENI